MKIEIENERVNRLLHRTELDCVIETDGVTPSRNEIIKQIAAKKGVNENLVIVDKIDQEYGMKKSNAYVKIYESEKAAQSIENKHQIERAKKAMDVKETPKAEEAPAVEDAPAEEPKAEAAEEKPAEPAKEEPKAEEAPAEEKKEGEE